MPTHDVKTEVRFFRPLTSKNEDKDKDKDKDKDNIMFPIETFLGRMSSHEFQGTNAAYLRYCHILHYCKIFPAGCSTYERLML